MSQSLSKIFIHVVFSTKNRLPLITPSVEDELYAYLSGICNNLECIPFRIGGMRDHVHILCLLSKKLPVSKLVEELKKGSSRWIKEKGPGLNNFKWQSGYAAFAIDVASVDRTVQYIQNQKEHHKSKSFSEELILLLEENDIEYDERYLFSEQED